MTCHLPHLANSHIRAYLRVKIIFKPMTFSPPLESSVTLNFKTTTPTLLTKILSIFTVFCFLILLCSYKSCLILHKWCHVPSVLYCWTCLTWSNISRICPPRLVVELFLSISQEIIFYSVNMASFIIYSTQDGLLDCLKLFNIAAKILKYVCWTHTHTFLWGWYTLEENCWIINHACLIFH